MGVSENEGYLTLGTLNSRCRIIIGTQKGTLILTTTHMRAHPGLEPKRVPSAVARILQINAKWLSDEVSA